VAFSDKFYHEIGMPCSQKELNDEQRRALARSIQDACCELVTELVESFRKQEKITHVCLAGGLFHNSLLVAALEKNLGLDKIFVPPAPGDAGTACGATYLAWHEVLRRPRTEPVHDVYRGPTFSRQQTKDVLDNCKARYSLQNTEKRKIEATLQLLQAGKIVGWFQGAAEFGARALGNRSILASPWGSYVQENLNDYVKHREGFRPFAISVPEEDCPLYFEASQQCRFMNSLGRVRPGHCLPARFLLPDGQVRLHVVEKRSNSLFWQLLKSFGEQAPAPMLLNTSFNLFGEPLVVTPRDAVRSYFCSGLDALVIDLFVLSKNSIPVALPLSAAGGIRVST
jgi:carbamoyltransferase